MRPDEANDEVEAPVTSEAGSSGTPSSEQPASVDNLDEGGDPACWLGLIDDQRDHQ